MQSRGSTLSRQARATLDGTLEANKIGHLRGLHLWCDPLLLTKKNNGGYYDTPHWVLCALCQIEGFKRGSYPPFIRPQTPHGEALRVGLRSHTARPCRTYPEGQGVGCPHRTKDILALRVCP